MELMTVPHAAYSDFKLLLSDAPTTSGAYSNFAILRWLTEFTVTGACGKLRPAISLRPWQNLRLWQIRTLPFDIEVGDLDKQNSSHELLQASAD